MDSENFNKDIDKIKNQLQSVNQEQLKTYIELLDRYLLYNVVAAHLSPEIISKIIESWEQTIKKSINIEVVARTSFLENTHEGRLAKLNKMPDGEAFRLESLKILNIAKSLVQTQLKRPDDEGNQESF